MRLARLAIFLIAALFSAHTLLAKEIVVGVDFLPQKTKAIIFTPLVLTKPISFKAAFEYRLNAKFNLVVPLEAHWMNYRWLMKLFDSRLPEILYEPETLIKPGVNLDFSRLLIASGLGLKAFPFSQSMTNAFFIKAMLLIGYERFNAFAADGVKEGAAIIQTYTLGYNWVKGDIFTFGVEAGLENTFHTNPIKKLPNLFPAFFPIFQFNLGFIF